MVTYPQYVSVIPNRHHIHSTSLELYNSQSHTILFDRSSIHTDILTDRQIDLLAPTVDSMIQFFRLNIDVFTTA